MWCDGFEYSMRKYLSCTVQSPFWKSMYYLSENRNNEETNIIIWEYCLIFSVVFYACSLYTMHYTLYAFSPSKCITECTHFAFCVKMYRFKTAFPQSLYLFLFIFAVHFFQFKLYIKAFFPIFTIHHSPAIHNTNSKWNTIVCVNCFPYNFSFSFCSIATDGFCYGGWLHKTLFSNDLCSMSCFQRRNGIRQTKRRFTF